MYVAIGLVIIFAIISVIALLITLNSQDVTVNKTFNSNVVMVVYDQNTLGITFRSHITFGNGMNLVVNGYYTFMPNLDYIVTYNADTNEIISIHR